MVLFIDNKGVPSKTCGAGDVQMVQTKRVSLYCRAAHQDGSRQEYDLRRYAKRAGWKIVYVLKLHPVQRTIASREHVSSI
jgi:hypothetical protein